MAERGNYSWCFRAKIKSLKSLILLFLAPFNPTASASYFQHSIRITKEARQEEISNLTE